jgi:ubiquinone biosynthesis protein Coq4
MSAQALVKDTYRVGLAVVRVLGDSNLTSEIHRVEEITGRPRFRALLREYAETPEGRRLLAERPELSSQHVDYDRLRRLPAQRSSIEIEGTASEACPASM